uniref:Protein LTV1 homolog n=1 Tax=Aceria tosichella TaxID=561515 RepID=A0A6G1S3H5_9ACAR
MSSKEKSKKKSVKFVLAPRPQRDPLAADFEAPQHILVPKGGLDVEEARKKLPDFDPILFESKDETKTGMLERAHLANGMTFDPDVLQAMSKDFDYEDPNNILDDTFVTQAGGFIQDEGEMLADEVSDLTKDLFNDEPELVEFGPDDEEEEDEAGGYDDEYDSDNYDIDGELMGRMRGDRQEDTGFESGQGRRLILFKKKSTRRGIESDREKLNHQNHDDNKSVFTNYSMTSSVMRRSQGLQEMDEHFERLFEKEYADDTEIGALDLKDVKGDELLTSLAQIKGLKEEVKEARNLHHGEEYKPEIVSEHYKNAIIGDDPVPDDEDTSEDESNRRANRFDCESILSLNSNLYNHPKTIIEGGRRRRSASKSTSLGGDRMDLDEDSDQRSRSEVSRSIASTRASIVSKLSIRPKDEAPEERRARKKALKAYRQERRKERKQNQQIFKTEQTNIIKQQRNNRPALRLA